MRSRREIIEEYNANVDQIEGTGIVGTRMIGDLKLMTVSSQIIIELLLDIRDAINRVPGSP